MFADVQEARNLRAEMIANPENFRYPVRTVCPVCRKPTADHNGTVRTTEGWYLNLPCWSRNEWDRFGLHIRPVNG